MISSLIKIWEKTCRHNKGVMAMHSTQNRFAHRCARRCALNALNYCLSESSERGTLGLSLKRWFGSSVENFDGRGHLYLAFPDFDQSTKKRMAKIDKGMVATKIGHVKGGLEAVKRLKSALQTGNQWELKFISFPCKYAPAAEKFWHSHFQDKHHRGEWYCLDSADKEKVATEMEDYDKSGKLMGRKDTLDPFLPSARKAVGTDKREREPNTTKKEKVQSVLRKHTRLLQNDQIKAGLSYLEKEELDLVLDALKSHPESLQKIGCGVKAIFVAATTFWNRSAGDYSYCFHVKRMDGSEEDFSYKYCFGFRAKRGKQHYSYQYIAKDEFEIRQQPRSF